VSEKFFDYTTNLSIELAKSGQDLSSLQIVFQPAAEPLSFGKPGKQTGEVILSQTPDGKHLATVSLGEEKKIKSDTYRQAGGLLARWLKQSHVENADIFLKDFKSPVPDAFSALLEGLFLGAFEFDRYKKRENSPVKTKLFVFAEKNAQEVGSLITRAVDITSAINLARDWAHEPANVINPITLAERAQVLAQKFGLKCTILDEKELEKMKAGGILAVGQGSKTPSRLIVLEYAGSVQTRPVVLVGKALTFDSGGYSLKSVESIQTMKYDKCGGVTVAATLMAAALLKVKTPIIGVIGAAENMVSDEAYRPDDILTMLSGKTVEIVTTDAEGRLVLADALTYAQNNYQPQAIIDLATLTGGVVTALGRVRAGLMSNNDELANQLFASGEATHELLWRLPLDDDYLKNTKGDDADLKNSGGREAHPIMGGIFLKQFVDDGVPWAHLDIAGVADNNKETPYNPKGATGFGIRLLVNYIESLP
jgi:leucyl aminopeptidase